MQNTRCTSLLCRASQNTKHTVLLVSFSCISPADCTGHCSVTAQKTATHLHIWSDYFSRVSFTSRVRRLKRESVNQQVRRQDEEGKTTRCHHGTPFIATMLPSAPPLSYCRRRHAIVKMLHPPRRHLAFPSFHCNYCCIFSSPPRCTTHCKSALNTLNLRMSAWWLDIGQPHHSMNEHWAGCNMYCHRGS